MQVQSSLPYEPICLFVTQVRLHVAQKSILLYCVKFASFLLSQDIHAQASLTSNQDIFLFAAGSDGAAV